MISPCYLAPHIHNWSQKSVSESRLSSSSIRDFQWAHLHERGGGKRNPLTQIQCSRCRALLMSTDADENTTLEKKLKPNWKRNTLKTEDSGATYVTRVTRRRGGAHRAETATAGAEFPLLWCQHLFCQATGSWPHFHWVPACLLWNDRV